MIAERDYFRLSPMATYDIYLAREAQIDELSTRVGELEDELEKEAR